MNTFRMSDLAKSLAVSERTINYRDPNISNRNPAAESSTFTGELSFKCDQFDVTIRFNGTYALLAVKVFCHAGVWSINHSDKVMMTRRRLHPPFIIGTWPLFVLGNASPIALELWKSKEFETFLGQLDLKEDESLHYYVNAVSLYQRPISVNHLLGKLAYLTNFLRSRAQHDKKPLTLPKGFADLADIVERWSISDDKRRTDILREAPIADLCDLASRVCPRIPEIKDYLVHNHCENDLLLSTLSEAACEARLIIDQRQASS